MTSLTRPIAGLELVSMKEVSAKRPASSCWTCRRRRVKCDGKLPHCHKCSVAGEACQGYSEERPLRWTNGVASRGKLMGKSLPIPDDVGAPFPRLLLDPILQDLSPKARHYIKYCGSFSESMWSIGSLADGNSVDRFCSTECVLYTSNAANPFRECMRLIPKSSALLHTIISLAALHKARRSSESPASKSIDLIKTEDNPPAIERELATTTPTQLSTLQEALLHKQYALKNIRNDLDNLNCRNVDAIVASVLLLLWQDLIDSGTDSWKYHLDALKGIVPFGLYPLNLPTAKDQQYYCQEMQNNFEMTYAVFQILGTTFIKNKELYQPLFSSMPTLDAIKFYDGQSWAGCPAELLCIISLLNNVSQYDTPSLDSTHAVLSEFNRFSPMNWAIANKSPSLMKPRFHLASAYKGAVGIYMAQVFLNVPEDATVASLNKESIDALVLHIKSIGYDDAHFKSLVWPAFVIGAEAETEAQRDTIIQVFEHLWTVWRCENVKNALAVLRFLWARNDQRGYSGQWINDLYGWGMNWIFI